MNINLSKPLDCINKKDLLSFKIENQNGAFVLITDHFTQVLKRSEYNLIINSINNFVEVAPAKNSIKEKSEEVISNKPRRGRPSKKVI